MTENKNTYETKCRRCGHITEWHHSLHDTISALAFKLHMDESVNKAGLHQCNVCKKLTVQDLVSY